MSLCVIVKTSQCQLISLELYLILQKFTDAGFHLECIFCKQQMCLMEIKGPLLDFREAQVSQIRKSGLGTTVDTGE